MHQRDGWELGELSIAKQLASDSRKHFCDVYVFSVYFQKWSYLYKIRAN